MKYTFKILLILKLTLIFHFSYSQDINEKKYIQEIKMIFREAANKKFKLPFILGPNDSLTLPLYFTNYIKYYDIKRKFDKINMPYFDQSNNFNLNLNKNDCEILNNSMLNDTCKLFIQKSWFEGYNVKILSDSITKI